MIIVPTFLLDEEKCRRNIRMMASKARENGVIFRPHFKTHVSRDIGEWFREEGVDRITVSSFRMARYFAEEGWNDILVAFPVNIPEIDTINSLSGKVKLSILAESSYTVEFLGRKLENPVDVYIKIDLGYNRTGISYDDTGTINSVLSAISKSGKMRFTGFLSHSGQSYNARSVEEIMEIHNKSIEKILEIKAVFIGQYPDLIISLGDTPTCSIAEDFTMIDEIRPGNFVFFDLMQVIIGSCSPDMVAVAMACPVVAVHPERNELVIYGGAVHFSKESITDATGRRIYGMVLEDYGPGWGDIVEDAILSKLSQEHGIVEAPAEYIKRFKPGDIIKIMPVHSCLTAHAMREYQTLQGRTVTMMS